MLGTGVMMSGTTEAGQWVCPKAALLSRALGLFRAGQESRTAVFDGELGPQQCQHSRGTQESEKRRTLP